MMVDYTKPALMTRKILYFTADEKPTTEELAHLSELVGNVQVRNSRIDARYGENLEAADGLAGSIPAAYLTGEDDTVDTAVFPLGDVTPVEEP